MSFLILVFFFFFRNVGSRSRRTKFGFDGSSGRFGSSYTRSGLPNFKRVFFKHKKGLFFISKFHYFIISNFFIFRFEALIEREWVLAGHPFATRCAHAAYARTRGDYATEGPTYLLFLDCVWQVRLYFDFTYRKKSSMYK